MEIFVSPFLKVSTGVVTANSESWVRSGWLADQLWKIDTRVNTLNPVHKHLSIEIRVGYLAAIAAFVGMLGIVSVERTILRALLSYKVRVQMIVISRAILNAL